MKRKLLIIAVILLSLTAAVSCGGKNEPADGKPVGNTESVTEVSSETPEEEKEEEKEMKIKIDGTVLDVEWEDNGAVDALKALVKEGELVIGMHMYGGFEQVGDIGRSLPSSDRQTVTSPGDIVLYSSDSIVVFYGSNSWSYTRLGRIVSADEDELTDMLGNGDAVLTVFME